MGFFDGIDFKKIQRDLEDAIAEKLKCTAENAQALLQDQIKAEADKLYEQIRLNSFQMTNQDIWQELELTEEEMTVEGSVTYPVVDPARLIEDKKHNGD